jgi:dihydrofolate reductase
MKTKIILSAIVAVSTGLISLTCTNTIGNGSDIGNAVVVGKLYAADGVTPAAGVCVHIRPKKSLADTSGIGLIKRLSSLTAVDSVTTDDAGWFAFDSTLDTGTYVITSASGNNAVLIDSVSITNRDLTDSLPPDTLKPAGALKGVIMLSEGGDKSNIFMLAFGIDKFARVDADGKFKFQNLAEAVYDLRIISSLADYRALDIYGISVWSKDTTDMDTIELPFIGIPTPKNVSIIYDTTGQIIALTWNKADTALVKGYNIYRRNIDSNFAVINRSIVMDTTYFDNTLAEDGTYEYLVAALDKQNNEGNRSLAITVVFKNRLQLATSAPTFGQRWEHSSVAFDGKMWVIGGTNGGTSSDYKNDVWYCTDGVTWTQATTSAGFSPRRGHASLVFDSKMWVIGGFDTGYNRKNDVWYSVDGITWTQATDSTNFPARMNHDATVFNDKMWVIGGYGDGGNRNDVWWSTDGITWILAKDSAGFSPRTSFTLAVADEKMWVIGGYDVYGALNDVWCSDSGTIWTRATSSAEFSSRYAHSSAVIDSTIWIIGGYRAPVGALGDLWYSNNGVHWNKFNPPPNFMPRSDHSSIVLDNKIWIIGHESDNLKTEVWYLQ